MKITFKHVRMGRMIKREFDSKEAFVSYMASTMTSQIKTFEQAVAYAEKSSGATLSIEE